MTMKALLQHLVIAFVLLSITKGQAQDVYQMWQGEEISSYKEDNLEEYEKVAWGVDCAFNITQPTLVVYPAKGDNTGGAVVVLPGGGYVLEAIAHESHDVVTEVHLFTKGGHGFGLGRIADGTDQWLKLFVN